MKKLSVLLLALLLVVALASCDLIQLPEAGTAELAQAALDAAFGETELEITEDLVLDKKITDAEGNEYEIAWAASANVTLEDGEDKVTVKVTQDLFEDKAFAVAGAITVGDATAKVSLTYTVPALVEEGQKLVDAALDAAFAEKELEATENFTLLTELVDAEGNKYALTWVSSDEAVLNVNGANVVVTPSYFGDSVVTLTGTATKGKVSANVVLTYTVAKEECEHDYELFMTTDPTCAEFGNESYRCNYCGRTYMTSIPMLPHNYELTETVEAEPTAHGYNEYTCTECLGTVRETLHAYVYEYPYADPTCTEDGFNVMICYVCATEGYLVYDENDPNAFIDVPATGHLFIDGVCVYCEEEYVEETAWILITELNDGDEVLIGNPASGKLLSVKKTGYYNVGINYSADDFSNVTNDETFVVTVNEDGSYTFTSLSGKVIAMAASNNSLNETGTNDAWYLTARDDGTTFLVKNVVRGTYLEWYKQYSNWSTFGTASDDQFYISFYAKNEDYAHVHNYISEEVLPTCTEDGYTSYTCACEDSFVEEGDAATGVHEYVNGVCACGAVCEHTGGTATCFAQAVCEVCGTSYGEQPEHVWGEDDKCTAPGCDAEKPTDPTDEPTGTPSEPVLAGSADFDTIVTTSASGYSGYDKTFTTTAGWTTVNSAIQSGGATNSNPQFTVIGDTNATKAVCLNGKTTAAGQLTSPTLTGGVKKITVSYTKMFTDTEIAATIKVTDLTTGAVYTFTIAQVTPKGESTVTDEQYSKYVVWNDEFVLETPITGDFTIEVVNDCPTGQSSNKDRLTILSLEWYN